MDTIYLVSLLVGGFFVLLSMIGGDAADADADAEVDFDADFDLDAEVDFDVDADFDTDAGADIGGGVGFIDLLSVRALFLFAAFFGLTGVALGWVGTLEPIRALLAVGMGLITGLGGNYLIKRVGYAHVSSNVSTSDMRGKTAHVLLPFEAGEKGKISLVVKGNRVQLLARSLGDEVPAFERGEEVVVVRLDGGIAEVVRPN